MATKEVLDPAATWADKMTTSRTLDPTAGTTMAAAKTGAPWTVPNKERRCFDRWRKATSINLGKVKNRR